MDANETRERKAASTVNAAKEPAADQQALDGGWGWMCVVGCTFVHFLIGGYVRSYGLIFMQLRHHFNSSAALTAWVGGTNLAIMMGFSPLSNALSRRFSARRVVFVGGLMFGTGCVLNAFATSTEYMIFSYSLVAGFGSSLVFSPSIVIVGEYFEQRRGIAVGLATAGSSVGAFVMPLMTIFLFEHYGFFSGLLVIGALMYNTSVCGALYRPFEDNFRHHVTSQKQKVLSTCDGREDAEGSYRHGRDGVTVKGGPLPGPQNVAVDCRRNKLARFSQTIRTAARSLDLSVWKDKGFMLFALSQAVMLMSDIPVSMLAPDVVHNNGLTKAHAAFMLSAMASGDFVGRIFSGFVFELPMMQRCKYRPFSAALLFMSIAVLVWPFIASFAAAMFNAVIYGVCTGAVIAQRTSMLCDLLGHGRLSSSLGMLLWAQGIGVLVGPLGAGWCRDYFGNYKVPFLFIGVLLAVASVLSYASGVVAAANQQKTNEQVPQAI